MDQVTALSESEEIADIISYLLTSVRLAASGCGPCSQDSPICVRQHDEITDNANETINNQIEEPHGETENPPGCHPSQIGIDMKDSFTTMSQEPNFHPHVETKDAFTAMSQELEKIIEEARPAIETKDSITSMSQEFLLSHAPVVDCSDAFTTSDDLYQTVDVSTNMDNNKDLAPFSFEQVVPADSFNELQPKDEEHAFYDADTQQKQDSPAIESIRDDHLVPEYPDDKSESRTKNEIQNESIYQRKVAKIIVTESDSPSFQDREDMLHKSKGVSRFYEYYDEMDENKENIAPENCENATQKGCDSGTDTGNVDKQMYIPNPEHVNSGIFLRLGLSKRAKPTKRLHDPFRRLI